MPIRYFVIALLFCLGIATTQLSAQEAKSNVFTDPAKAGLDFQYQGEYVGTLTGDPTRKFGIQIIALGKGEFDLVACIGGLPGDGWNRGDDTHRGKGKIEGDKVIFQSANPDDHAHAELKDGALVLFDQDNNKIMELTKTNRTSPTMGAKPPQGAIVLFDGTNVDQFENGKMVEDKLLGATNCFTKEKFGDHLLHIEFRTPFMPEARGQGRGNSGVYAQERYEIQVLDSFGLDGENNECGGIYSIAKPIVNMCLPPLSWQTYDIDFKAAKYEGDKKVKNARVTIKHNGIVIHDDLELKQGTPGRASEGPEPAGLFLQDHSNPVAFRNIWVLKK